MRIALAFVVVASLAGCSREDDGRDVVMVAPEEGTGGEETGLSDRPATRTIGGGNTGQLTPYEQEALDASRDLESQGQYLDRLLAADSCDDVGQLRDRICDLAGRICAIADAHPESPRTRTQCNDANARCTDAAQRVGEQCEY